jgi:very-short-patch-repair endonuclease
MKYPEIKEIARSLRKKQTKAEKIFWLEFRNRKFNNLKFNRQYPIIYQTDHSNEHYFYVADFYCHEKKLVVELDGPIHKYTKEKDYNRDKVIEGLGLKVIRFNNSELNNIVQIKRRLLEIIHNG